MKSKSIVFLIVTLCGAIAYFLFGWLVFDFILGDYTNNHTTQLEGFKKSGDVSSMLFIMLSCFAYSALVSFILVYLSNNHNLPKSYLIGFVIGVLVAIMTDSYWYGTSNFYSNATVVVLDIIAAGITVGFMSFVISYVKNRIG